MRSSRDEAFGQRIGLAAPTPCPCDETLPSTVAAMLRGEVHVQEEAALLAVLGHHADAGLHGVPRA